MTKIGGPAQFRPAVRTNFSKCVKQNQFGLAWELNPLDKSTRLQDFLRVHHAYSQHYVRQVGLEPTT